MLRRLSAVILSVVLLSSGWLGGTGLTLLAAFVPLLWLNDSYGAVRRRGLRIVSWALLTFVLWNAATIWWIWGATPVGPVAATVASSALNIFAFSLYVLVSARAPRRMALTVLVSAWIATEYWYTVGEFSWPWLILGNGFSHDVRLVQWYEFTGVFGGSLWVLLSNIAIYEALRCRTARRVAAAAVCVAGPMLLSLGIYLFGDFDSQGSATVTIVQPNVPVYEYSDPDERLDNLLTLACQAPADVDFIIMPETAIDDVWAVDESRPEANPAVDTLAWLMRTRYPRSTLIAGVKSMRFYPSRQTATARAGRGYYYDIYNSAIGLDSAGVQGIYHKGRLVIGVEKMPMPWLFEWLEFLVIDLGGTVGQLGVSSERMTFRGGDVDAGAAICYEGLYGDFYGGFVRRGASVMLIISNDGWWGDTPGYRHLFSNSRLRAVEHRRAIARSANTGKSGFISPRGDVGATLGWDERGTLTAELPLVGRTTFYTRYGDYIGRLSVYLLALSLLCYTAYRVRRRSHLTE